jgi:hypothetical protein
MTKKIKPRSPTVADVITSICVAVNAAEGCDDMTEHEVKALRDALYTVKNRIGGLKAYDDNTGMKTLDAAFTAAGWDHQGLRWTKGRGSDKEDPQQVFVVNFTGAAHSRWFKP